MASISEDFVFSEFYDLLKKKSQNKRIFYGMFLPVAIIFISPAGNDSVEKIFQWKFTDESFPFCYRRKIFSWILKRSESDWEEKSWK